MRRTTNEAATALTALALAAGLSSCTPSYRRCPNPEWLGSAASPITERRALSATGLYKDVRRGELEDGVVAYRPRFELWSDGAVKRRWIRLPPGETIDARDMDAWQFPQGTKIWKEFARDGVRAETRLLEKIGPAEGDWLAVGYLWNADGSDAIAAPEGATDVLGTTHDIPPSRDCMGCHLGNPGRVLGFSAIQLAHAAPDDEWSLARLEREGRLRGSPGPVPEIPGDERTRSVLGYLHANCGSCHNQHRAPEQGGRCYNPRREVDLSLRVGELGSVEATALFRTAMGKSVVPGDPEASSLYKRSRGDLHFFQARMPSLGSEILDPTLLPLLDEWIRALPKPASN